MGIFVRDLSCIGNDRFFGLPMQSFVEVWMDKLRILFRIPNFLKLLILVIKNNSKFNWNSINSTNFLLISITATKVQQTQKLICDSIALQIKLTYLHPIILNLFLYHKNSLIDIQMILNFQECKKKSANKCGEIDFQKMHGTQTSSSYFWWNLIFNLYL